MIFLKYFLALLFGVSYVQSGILNWFKATTENPLTGVDTAELKTFLVSSGNGKYTPPLNNLLASKQNIWERSGKFEGDILLNPDQIQSIVDDASGMRNAMIAPTRLWPSKIIPYIISSTFTPAQVTAITKAMNNISAVSCVKFEKRKLTNTNYLTIKGNDPGCFSYIGMNGGPQDVNFEPGCFLNGILVHELLHAVGFFHMHSTHNRDSYVSINWPKILPAAVNDFRKFTSAQANNYDVPYDYGSILHYSQYAFSIDGNKTIIPLQPTTLNIGQRDKMTAGDIRKLNLLYSCPAVG